MDDYLDAQWRPILEYNGLASFDALWQLDVPWFEPPNERRGGWSGVARVELKCPDGSRVGVFLKRQENHNTPTWLHPWRGAPTFRREFKRIRLYQRCEVPSLEPVFFAMRSCGKDDRAILMTAELDGFVSLDQLNEDLRMHGQSAHAGGIGLSDRRAVIMAVARLVRRMHAQRLRHGCLFGKHVFVRKTDAGQIEARVIDLEKTHRPLAGYFCAEHDLYSLERGTYGWRLSDKVFFLREYLQLPRLSAYAKRLWRAVSKRAAKKRAQRNTL